MTFCVENHALTNGFSKTMLPAQGFSKEIVCRRSKSNNPIGYMCSFEIEGLSFAEPSGLMKKHTGESMLFLKTHW